MRITMLMGTALWLSLAAAPLAAQQADSSRAGVKQDTKELRRERREGDSTGVKRERKELRRVKRDRRHDRRDLHEDRAEKRDDRRDGEQRDSTP